MNLREALAWLCAAEVARKDQLRMEMALRLARFPDVRTLEAFDFEAQPSIDPAQIRELATCRWVANGDTLPLLGHSVQYVGAMELISALAKAQAQHALEARLTQVAKTRLLIIDELGYLPLGAERGVPVLPADLPLLPARQCADDPRRQLPAQGEPRSGGPDAATNDNDTTPTDETPIQGPPQGPRQPTIRWTSFRVARGPTADVA